VNSRFISSKCHAGVEVLPETRDKVRMALHDSHRSHSASMRRPSRWFIVFISIFLSSLFFDAITTYYRLLPGGWEMNPLAHLLIISFGLQMGLILSFLIGVVRYVVISFVLDLFKFHVTEGVLCATISLSHLLAGIFNLSQRGFDLAGISFYIVGALSITVCLEYFLKENHEEDC